MFHYTQKNVCFVLAGGLSISGLWVNLLAVSEELLELMWGGEHLCSGLHQLLQVGPGLVQAILPLGDSGGVWVAAVDHLVHHLVHRVHLPLSCGACFCPKFSEPLLQHLHATRPKKDLAQGLWAINSNISFFKYLAFYVTDCNMFQVLAKLSGAGDSLSLWDPLLQRLHLLFQLVEPVLLFQLGLLLLHQVLQGDVEPVDVRLLLSNLLAENRKPWLALMSRVINITHYSNASRNLKCQ